MKKIGFTSVLAIAAIGVMATSFLANSEALESPSPEEFVEEYLELGKANDYDKLVDMVVDDRFNNDRQTKIDTYKALEEDVPALKEYEIKEVKGVIEDTATVVTVLEFDDGSIEQRPMHLVKQNENWRLHISGGDASDDEDFKLIKQ